MALVLWTCFCSFCFCSFSLYSEASALTRLADCLSVSAPVNLFLSQLHGEVGMHDGHAMTSVKKVPMLDATVPRSF